MQDYLYGSLFENVHIEHEKEDGRIILKLMIQTQVVRVGRRWNWLTACLLEGYCATGTEPPGSSTSVAFQRYRRSERGVMVSYTSVLVCISEFLF
jgi:hypothetical protein